MEHVPFPLQMARYYRRRPYRRPYSVSFRFGRQRRRFNRQLAGAMQQRDIARFIVKSHSADTVSIATQGGFWAINRYQVRDVLNHAPLFLSMKEVFDQFKVNAVKIRIVPSTIVSVDDSTLTSVIAWDRNGHAENLNFEQLASYGSAKINYYSPGSKTVQNHWLAAETVGEKTSYIPTTDPTLANSALFDPHFMVGIRGPSALGAEQMYLLAYTIEWTFDITFRGVRSTVAQ